LNFYRCSGFHFLSLFLKYYFLPFFLYRICLEDLKPFFVNIFMFLTFNKALTAWWFLLVCFMYILYFFSFFKIKLFHQNIVICARLNSSITLFLLFFFILYPLPVNFILLKLHTKNCFKNSAVFSSTPEQLNKYAELLIRLISTVFDTLNRQ